MNNSNSWFGSDTKLHVDVHLFIPDLLEMILIRCAMEQNWERVKILVNICKF